MKLSEKRKAESNNRLDRGNEKSKQELIASIESDAQKEAERIIHDAEQTAKEKKESAKIKIERIQRETQQKIEEQTEAIKTNTDSAIEVEKRRIALQMKESVFAEVLSRVKRKFAALIESSEYPSILMGWIVEGTIGLQSDSVIINASEKERDMMNEKFLSDCTKRVKEVSQKEVTLGISDRSPLKEQGVMVTAENGRTAFNNTLETRIMRHRTKIRTMVFQELFPEM